MRVKLLLSSVCLVSCACGRDTKAAPTTCDSGATAPDARLVLQRRETPIGGGRAYTVEIHPDGTVLYDGEANVRVKGKTTWRIAPEAAKAIFAKAACAGAASWKARYDIGTDDLRATVTIDLGISNRYVIENDTGCPPSPMLIGQAPQALCDLENAIDATAAAGPAVLAVDP